jgi:hypothetical protein
MLSLLKRIKNTLTQFLKQEKNRNWVLQDKRIFLSAPNALRKGWINGPDYFCSSDKTKQTGFDRHYVYHPAWAIRKVLRDIKPERHLDISSTLHFVSHLSAFLPVVFYDYRPADLALDQLEVGQADLTALPFDDNSIESISCMHTIEHVGLGRYGDALDPDGDLKSIWELQRVTAKGGSLLLVVPVGEKSRIQFNAHRVYQPEWIVEQLPELQLQEFYFIPGQKGTPEIISAHSQSISGENYGCGCFWFKKPS